MDANDRGSILLMFIEKARIADSVDVDYVSISVNHSIIARASKKNSQQSIYTNISSSYS